MSRLFSGTPFDRPISCEICGKAVADCRCLKLPPKKKMSEQPGGKHASKPQPNYELTPENSTPPKDQVARISLEKRKGGREVTLISGLDHPANDLPKLCTQLKSSLGTGGSVQARTIELQGDKRDAVALFLQKLTFKTRII